jgi:nitrogenase iron protein NifH
MTGCPAFCFFEKEIAMAAEQIVVIGKSGVGTSTTATNLSAALAETGKRVASVGYGSRWDSTATLRGDGELVPLSGSSPNPVFAVGFRGALCIEMGDTADGNVASSIQQIVTEHRADYLVHDIAWEPGGDFFLPFPPEERALIFVVTTADFASIGAVNDFFHWFRRAGTDQWRFGGVVVNNVSGPFYESVVADFLNVSGAPLATSVPASLMVSASELCGLTLIEAAPHSHTSFVYRKLVKNLLTPLPPSFPRPLSREELSSWARKWGDIIAELETGSVQDGGGI